jgi:phosphoglycerol transferase
MISFLRRKLAYLIAAGLCLAGFVMEYRLWRADLHIPLYYDAHNDVFYYLCKLKTLRETGWVLTNPWLGAPGVQEDYDFNQGDNLQFLIARVIGEFTPDFGTMVNLCSLAFSLLTTWASLYVLRHLGISDSIAVVLGVLYALAPYAFIRGQGHLPQSSYVSAPLMILVAVWLCECAPIFWAADDRGKAGPGWFRGRTLPALVATISAGSSGAYYAFFGCGCAAAAVPVVLFRTRKLARLADPLIALALICGVFALNIAPKLWYNWRHGSNPVALDRWAEQSIEGGLDISALIQPVPYHGLKSLALAALGRTRDVPSPKEYYPTFRMPRTQAIGTTATCGFLLLLLTLFSPRRPRGTFRPLFPLSRLNIAFVLVGTIGGFSLVFARRVTPMIRDWSRLSIYIAFVSLAAVGLMLEHIRRTRVGEQSTRILFGAALAGLLIFGLIDQMPQGLVPAYDAARAEFDRDREFARAIEAALPEKAMVFQLPYVEFPEAYSAHLAEEWLPPDYSFFRPYLHSTRIRWSSGAVRGRGVDRWQARVAEEPVPKMVKDLLAASFRGITIDRGKYEDGADAAIIDGLKKILGTEPISDSRGERLFFVLPGPRRGAAPQPGSRPPG